MFLNFAFPNSFLKIHYRIGFQTPKMQNHVMQNAKVGWPNISKPHLTGRFFFWFSMIFHMLIVKLPNAQSFCWNRCLSNHDKHNAQKYKRRNQKPKMSLPNTPCVDMLQSYNSRPTIRHFRKFCLMCATNFCIGSVYTGFFFFLFFLISIGPLNYWRVKIGFLTESWQLGYRYSKMLQIHEFDPWKRS